MVVPLLELRMAPLGASQDTWLVKLQSVTMDESLSPG